LVTIQFEWKDQVKPVGSSFIGTSPEFEMALYTVCLLMDSSGVTSIEMEDMDLTITTHRFIGRGSDSKDKHFIASSFPKAM
jgi:poly(U)-specific endoribonuclease